MCDRIVVMAATECEWRKSGCRSANAAANDRWPTCSDAVAGAGPQAAARLVILQLDFDAGENSQRMFAEHRGVDEELTPKRLFQDDLPNLVPLVGLLRYHWRKSALQVNAGRMAGFVAHSQYFHPSSRRQPTHETYETVCQPDLRETRFGGPKRMLKLSFAVSARAAQRENRDVSRGRRSGGIHAERVGGSRMCEEIRWTGAANEVLRGKAVTCVSSRQYNAAPPNSGGSARAPRAVKAGREALLRKDELGGPRSGATHLGFDEVGRGKVGLAGSTDEDPSVEASRSFEVSDLHVGQALGHKEDGSRASSE